MSRDIEIESLIASILEAVDRELLALKKQQPLPALVKDREPTLTTEVLEVEVDAETHHGQRAVRMLSDTEIQQEIRYESLREVDPEAYAPADADFMRAIAHIILRGLVEQWKVRGTRRPWL
jgi:hypothetical protein